MRRPLLIWKDIRILAEFYRKEMINDVINLMDKFTTKRYYKKELDDFVNAFRRVMTRPKYLSYILLGLIVISFAYWSRLISAILILAFFGIYFYSKWITKEPLKYYKKRYFE